MIPLSLATVARASGAEPIDAELLDGLDRFKIERVTTDSRDVRAGDLFVAIRGERFDGHAFIAEAFSKGAVACLCTSARTTEHGRTPNRPCLCVDDSVAALGRLAAYYRQHVVSPELRVIAVTGSNGKTTTKGMIDHVLRASMPGRAAPRSFNNEIGVPLTLLSVEAADRYLVVEIGTNAPGEVAALARMASPDVSVITSIGEAHLAGLGDLAGVAQEKASILDHTRPGGMAMVSLDRAEISTQLDRAAHLELVTFGFTEEADLRVTDPSGTLEGTTFTLDGRWRVELSLPGLHHATNAAAAFGVARWMGVDPVRIADRLRSFVARVGRTEVHRLDGLTLVDDSYNANPASMSAAVRTLALVKSGKRVLVIGDMLELADQAGPLHRALLREALRAGIDLIVGVGSAMADAALAEGAALKSGRVIPCPDADAACAALCDRLSVGDTVWLKASRRIGLDKVAASLREQWVKEEAVM